MYKVQFDTTKNVLQINLEKYLSEEDSIFLYQEIKKNIYKLDKNFNLLTDLTKLNNIDENTTQHIKKIMNIINKHGVLNIYRIISETNKDFGFNIMSMFHYSKNVKIKTFTCLEEANNYLILNTHSNLKIKLKTIIKTFLFNISESFRNDFFKIFLIALGFTGLILFRWSIKTFGVSLGYLDIILINLSAIWFGINGGLISAFVAMLVFTLEVIFFKSWHSRNIVFNMLIFRSLAYFGSGILVGFLIEKENKLKKQLTLSAYHDELTGFYNLRFLLRTLEKEFNHCFRHNKRFSIAIIDIDNFKSINDTFGHLVGNDILKNFAKIVEKHLRIEDSIGRYGGDEFFIIFRESDELQAKKCIERIQSDYKSIKTTSSNMINIKDLKLTFSAGIVSFNKKFDNVEQLIDCADKALYKAKANNKNCIVIS